jgi:prevent-host-death family protein
MKSIGVRELRQQASRYLREVERGETIEVTDRGRPVARLVPISAADVTSQLVADGRLVPPSLDLLRIRPLRPERGRSLPSKVLERLRSEER